MSDSPTKKYIMLQLDGDWDEEAPAQAIFPNASGEFVLELDDRTAMLYQHVLHDYNGPYYDQQIVMVEIVEQTPETQADFFRNVAAYQDREAERKAKERLQRERDAEAAEKKRRTREEAKLLKEAKTREGLYLKLKQEFEQPGDQR